MHSPQVGNVKLQNSQSVRKGGGGRRRRVCQRFAGPKEDEVRQDAKRQQGRGRGGPSFNQSVVLEIALAGRSLHWLADWLAPLSFPLRAILFLLGVLIVGRALFPTAALLQSKEVGLAKVCRYFPLSLCLADVEESDSCSRLALAEKCVACPRVLCQVVCLFMCVIVYAQ